MSLNLSTKMQNDGQQFDQNSSYEEASTKQEAKFKLPKLENDYFDRNKNFICAKHSPRVEKTADNRKNWTQKHFQKRNYINVHKNKTSNDRQFPKLNSVNVANKKDCKRFSSSGSEVDLLDLASGGCSDHDQPSLNDFQDLWLQEKIVSELKNLATALGIEDHIDSQSNSKASNIRWSPVKESIAQQWWKQSKKWTKHTEEIEKKHKSRPEYDRHAGKKTLRGLRRDPVVNVPGIGCSYRLPAATKRTSK